MSSVISGDLNKGLTFRCKNIAYLSTLVVKGTSVRSARQIGASIVQSNTYANIYSLA